MLHEGNAECRFISAIPSRREAPSSGYRQHPGGYCLTFAARLQDGGEVDHPILSPISHKAREAGFLLLCMGKQGSEIENPEPTNRLPCAASGKKMGGWRRIRGTRTSYE